MNKIISLILVMLLTFACADLDLPSDGRLTFNEIFANYPLTRNFYNSCRSYIPGFGLEYGNATPLASYCDEAHDSDDSRSGSAVNAWYNNRTSPFNNPLTYSFDWWERMFEGIRKCNNFLTCINDPEMATAKITEDEKNGWIAEVHVMRAFYYLQLVKRYGGVPLMDKPYELDHDYSQDRRPSFEECADFILADCDAALAFPEPASPTIGFRWNISNTDKGKLTRGVAWAIKSQIALYAASPLWYEAGSKYTWEYAATITKEALDQCLANGYELYNLPVDEEAAPNSYAWYFIQQSDASRSMDKETIYESGARTNVWRNAGTPITDGMSKAGAGPSQDLVDCYEMQLTGEMPFLGYSDADRLQPIPNPAATDYDPANPYEGRDPRFYASIYYNNAPRSLSANVDKDIFPIKFDFTDRYPDNMSRMTVTQEDDYIKIVTTGSDPYLYTLNMDVVLSEAEVRLLAFEYKSNKTVNDPNIYWCNPGPLETRRTFMTAMPEASEWTRYEYNINTPYNAWNFGKSELDHFRFDPTEGGAGLELYIRNMQIEVFTPPPPILPVETFVNGNCGISDRVTDTRFTRTGYYMRKFNNYRSGVNVDGDGFMKVFRLGELYMNFAEAAYQAYGVDVPIASTVAGGSAMTAREAVNAIRARVDMLPLPAMSKDEFEKRYRNERRVEFAFEEHRFFDVRRWKILNETDNFVTGMRITKDGANYVYNRFKLADRNTNSDKYLMFPIGQSEAAKMEEKTGERWQNPGW